MKKTLLALAFFLICNFFSVKSSHSEDLRIVSLAPSITQTLVTLGYAENIVGISLYCDQPFADAELPRLGVASTFNAENVLALNPTLVLGLDYLEVDYLPYHVVVCKTLEEVLESFVFIASLCGDAQRGIRYRDEIVKHIEDLRKEFSTLPKQTVLFSVWRDPSENGVVRNITSAGLDGYFSELLKIFNAENAIHSTIDYPVLSYENILTANPNVVIDLLAEEIADRYSLDDWTSMPIDAVKDNRVYISHVGVVPGPDTILFLDELANALRP